MRRSPVLASLSALAASVGAVLAFAAPAQAASVDYVALGDSYSSGVGAGSYIDASGSCQRSTKAYSALWAAANSPSSYTSVACSGATTDDVNADQLSALSANTSLVSITIGGNDIGFADIMTTCALQGTDACVAAAQEAEDEISSTLPGKLDTTYAGISQHAPNARVVVLDYPVFYQLGTTCIGLSEKSHAKIDEGINLLDDTLKAAAQRHGFAFADVRDIFVGHQICSGDKWLHALNWANIGVSYHPTATGQSSGYLPVFSDNA